MSNLLVAKARLLLGPTAATKKQIESVDTLQLQYARPSSPIARRGSIQSKLQPFITRGYVGTCPSDAYHDPLFRAMPHRLFYTATALGVGTAGESGELSIVPTLNMAFGGPCTWSFTAQVDGPPADVANVAVAAIGAQSSYQENEIRCYYGGAGFLLDLTAAAQGGTLASTAVPISSNRRSATGTQHTRSDVAQKGLEATLNLQPTSANDDPVMDLFDRPSGFLVIRRTDANYGYAFPCHVATSLNIAAPHTAAATLSATFSQTDGGFPVSSVPATADTVIAAGQEGYLLTANSIARHTPGNVAVGNDEFLIHGAPIAIL